MKGKKIIICLLVICIIFIISLFFIKNNETPDSAKKFNTEHEALQVLHFCFFFRQIKFIKFLFSTNIKNPHIATNAFFIFLL